VLTWWSHVRIIRTAWAHDRCIFIWNSYRPHACGSHASKSWIASTFDAWQTIVISHHVVLVTCWMRDVGCTYGGAITYVSPIKQLTGKSSIRILSCCYAAAEWWRNAHDYYPISNDETTHQLLCTILFIIYIQGGPSEVIQSHISKTSRDWEKCFVWKV